jgi:hypothetical protein
LREKGALIRENWHANWKASIGLCIPYKRKLVKRLFIQDYRTVNPCVQDVPIYILDRNLHSVLSVVYYQDITFRLAAYRREGWHSLYYCWLPLEFRPGRDCADSFRCFPHAVQ